MARVDHRIADRRREVRRRERQRRLRRTLTILTVAVVLGVLFAVERSSLVALERVEVSGLDRLTESEILAAADLPLGTSTVRLRLGPAEERIEALPGVKDATVQRADPLTVTIDVVERVPVLMVATGTARVVVDGDGVVIARAAGESVPLVELEQAAAIPVGSSVDDTPALAQAVTVLDELPGPLRVRVERVQSSVASGVTVVLDDATVVQFGDDTRVPEKARALAAVLEDLGARTVARIDVRAPRTPVVVASE